MKSWSKVDPQAPTPRADFVRVWLNDLYYGDSKQGKDYLLRVDDDKTENFCCLGRGCFIFGYSLNKFMRVTLLNETFKVAEISNETGMLPPTLVKFLKMSESGEFFFSEYRHGEKASTDVKAFLKKYSKVRSSCASLTNLNDHGVSFIIIALVMREFADRLFRELSTEELTYIRETKLEGNHVP